MEKFVWIVLILMVLCNLGIVIWVAIKNRESDEAYEKAIDEIYGRKK